uniref:Uncharacterized protein n=1 Tax=Kalanchoe fedtschenkoi TaxID=63787 RepID=A0A7N0UK11_KALFE
MNHLRPPLLISNTSSLKQNMRRRMKMMMALVHILHSEIQMTRIESINYQKINIVVTKRKQDSCVGSDDSKTCAIALKPTTPPAARGTHFSIKIAKRGSV